MNKMYNQSKDLFKERRYGERLIDIHIHKHPYRDGKAQKINRRWRCSREYRLYTRHIQTLSYFRRSQRRDRKAVLVQCSLKKSAIKISKSLTLSALALTYVSRSSLPRYWVHNTQRLVVDRVANLHLLLGETVVGRLSLEALPCPAEAVDKRSLGDTLLSWGGDGLRQGTFNCTFERAEGLAAGETGWGTMLLSELYPIKASSWTKLHRGGTWCWRKRPSRSCACGLHKEFSSETMLGT